MLNPGPVSRDRSGAPLHLFLYRTIRPDLLHLHLDRRAGGALDVNTSRVDTVREDLNAVSGHTLLCGGPGALYLEAAGPLPVFCGIGGHSSPVHPNLAVALQPEGHKSGGRTAVLVGGEGINSRTVPKVSGITKSLDSKDLRHLFRLKIRVYRLIIHSP